MNGFWIGGRKAYAAAMKEQYVQRLRTLKERLATAGSGDASKETLAEIDREKASYKKRCAAGRRSLF